MSTRRARRAVAVYLTQVLLVAAVYLGLGRLGLLWAIPPGYATAVWPPSGVALAAVLVWGYRVWPGVWLGQVLTNSLVVYANGGLAAAVLASPTNAGIALGGTLEALTGALLLRRLADGRRVLDCARGVVAFAALAGPLACALSATIGPTSLAIGGAIPWAAYGTHWWTWWLGDLAGVLLVTPALLAWGHDPRIGWRPARAAEAVVLAALLLGAGQFALRVDYRTVYLVMPLLVWAAFRFGQRGATLALLAAAGMAIWRTAQGVGPFAGATLNESLLHLQLFMGVAALTTLLLAAVLAERQRAEEARARLLAREQAARAEAEAAAQAREEFLSVAAHELRTPVTSLRGYAQVLLRRFDQAGGPDPAKVRRALQTFDQQTDKLTRLVNQLLDLSRVQAGRLVLERRATDVAALAESAAAAAQATSGQPLVVRAASPVWASVDPLRLEQVLVNLLDNAVKYGQGQGPIEVEVAWVDDGPFGRLRAGAPTTDGHIGVGAPSSVAGEPALPAPPLRSAQALSGAEEPALSLPKGSPPKDRSAGAGAEWVRLSVRDCGPGIPPEHRQQIFERFYQAHGEGHVGGLGLGLYISRQIVALHGGRIDVECPPEGGTRFVVTLPAGSDGGAAEPTGSEAARLPAGVVPLTRGPLRGLPASPARGEGDGPQPPAVHNAPSPAVGEGAGG